MANRFSLVEVTPQSSSPRDYPPFPVQVEMNPQAPHGQRFRMAAESKVESAAYTVPRSEGRE